MTGRDECRNFCPENSRKNRKKGLQNRNIHAIIPGVSTRRRTGIGMSPSGKAPDFDSGISSVQIRPSQPYDLLAQSAEQLPFKQWVRGSNPRQVTRATTETWWLFLFTNLPRKHCFRGNRDCQKRALPFFDKGIAVCRAHDLCALGIQIAQLRAKSRLRRLRSAQRCGARLAA